MPTTTDPRVNPWPARLKALRQLLDITQREAAERIGVSTSTWVSWENAQRVPGRITQRLLRKGLVNFD